mmetsp:Transcript_548/g.870  ORF Transcript_548/g.870 Transcript_548/m.870 type:complete len:102 (-) Transcript_548:591-896(-)
MMLLATAAASSSLPFLPYKRWGMPRKLQHPLTLLILLPGLSSISLLCYSPGGRRNLDVFTFFKFRNKILYPKQQIIHSLTNLQHYLTLLIVKSPDSRQLLD